MIVPPSLSTPNPTTILASDDLLSSQINALQTSQNPWANYWINVVCCVLFSVLCLVYCANALSTQHLAQQVMRECAGALSNPTVACHNENAMASFKETIRRHDGRHPNIEYQDYAYVDLYNGRQVTEQLVPRLSSFISADGTTGLQPCRVRLWHDQVIMISINGRSAQTYDDPTAYVGYDEDAAFMLGVFALVALIPWRKRSWTPLTDI